MKYVYVIRHELSHKVYSAYQNRDNAILELEKLHKQTFNKEHYIESYWISDYEQH